MIANYCSERKEKGSCMAERTGSEAVTSKVKLRAHRAGLLGKEEFCFFVCPISRPARRGLQGALPVLTNAFKRLALLIGSILLLAAIPGPTIAAEEKGDAYRADHRWINEAGFISGYGNGSIDEGNYKTLMLIAHLGVDINRFIPAFRHNRGTLSFFLEPQFNPALQQSDIEFGLGIGFQYAYPLTESISPYILLATGPHYISVDTTTQAKGFNFSNAAGVGFYLSLTKNIALNCGYRYRHVSNADLRLPNGGINSHIGLLGVSFFF
jgi:lipid A 3-O-deacylase